jgi:hypothetical protein
MRGIVPLDCTRRVIAWRAQNTMRIDQLIPLKIRFE